MNGILVQGAESREDCEKGGESFCSVLLFCCKIKSVLNSKVCFKGKFRKE